MAKNWTPTLATGSPPPVYPHDLVALAPAVRSVARHVLGASADPEEIDDCAAEVFRRALEGREHRTSGTSFGPWVLGIARHVCLDALRSKRRARNRRDDTDALDVVQDRGPNAEQRIDFAERALQLQTALAMLPEPQRIALLMHAEGHAYREIGEHLAVPLGTVCTWIARARRELARALGHDVTKERS